MTISAKSILNIILAGFRSKVKMYQFAVFLRTSRFGKDIGRLYFQALTKKNFPRNPHSSFTSKNKISSNLHRMLPQTGQASKLLYFVHFIRHPAGLAASLPAILVKSSGHPLGPDQWFIKIVIICGLFFYPKENFS